MEDIFNRALPAVGRDRQPEPASTERPPEPESTGRQPEPESTERPPEVESHGRLPDADSLGHQLESDNHDWHDDADIIHRKAQLRQRLIPERDCQPRPVVTAASKAIVARLKQLEPLLELLARHPDEPVGLYAAFRGEPDVRPLLPFLLAHGARVAFPAIVPSPEGGSRLLRFGVYEPDRPLYQFLSPGFFGVPEPPHESLLPFGAPMSALIMPGVAFDRRGARLGFGMAYYDCAIAAQERKPLLIGVGHAFQLLDEPLPLAGHDQCLDCIVLPDQTVVVK